jgi:hypothetical protein
MIKEDQMKTIARIALRNAHSLRWVYSGRCMFGQTCFGFITNREGMNNAVTSCQRHKIDYRTDNMGLDYIVYFPYVKGEDMQALKPRLETTIKKRRAELTV